MKSIYLLYQLNPKEGVLELCGCYTTKQQALLWKMMGTGRRCQQVTLNLLSPINPWDKDEFDLEMERRGE
jgi:hypothetical protein